MIEYDSLSISIQQQKLLVGTSLHIGEGDKGVLRGPSGCGKSSLLKCTVGTLPRTGGSVRIDGQELSAATVSAIRSRIAFIGQEPILGAATVREAIWLPFSFKAHRHSPPTETSIHKLCERLHLSTDILDKPCARISGGEKQRIALLRALLLDKTIFLADEVTSALDPDSRAAVMAELFRPGITLLSVSHDPEWIASCNRVIDIKENQLQEIAGGAA
jgi:putative ABC transport system ATP-binding protein